MSSNLQQFEKRLSECTDLRTDDVTQILFQDIYSVCNDFAGDGRADGVRLASNSPCEDRFNRVQELPLWNNKNWIVSTVLDGHNGWQTAAFLEKELLASVQSSLRKLQPELRTADKIQLAIKEAFVDLDHQIITTCIELAHNKYVDLGKKMQHIPVGMSGSCALLSLYDPTTSNLYTACTGDSRAILGHQTSDGTWAAIALSDDQNCYNKDESIRLHQEHLGEEDLTKDGKVLGLAVSRAFGDIPWKLPYDVQLDLGKRFMLSGPMEKSKILTPPYLIAEPVVTVIKVEQPSFLVLATDGLWNKCTNREVVDLVVRWLEAQPNATETMEMTPMTVWWKSESQERAKDDPGFDFLQRWYDFDVRFLEERTVIEDLNNVAVHLLRNACGGNHRELLAGTLAAQPPYARAVRDDTTIQVVFFKKAGMLPSREKY